MSTNSQRSARLRNYRDIRILDLEIFVTAAEVGSLRGASTRVDLGQPALTRRIQKLEDNVGISFFERSTSGIRLTSAGWKFLGRVRRILSEFKCAISDLESAGTGEQGEINIGLTSALSSGRLRDVLTEFFHRHQDVRARFVQAGRGELETLLSHRMIDIIYAPQMPFADNTDVLPFAAHQIYLAVSHDHKLADREMVSWADVATVPLIVGVQDLELEIELYTRGRLKEQRFKFDLHDLDREGIFNLVEMNFGSTLICEDSLVMNRANIIFLPVSEAGFSQSLQYCFRWCPENDNPALRRFLSLARDVAKAGVVSSGPS